MDSTSFTSLKPIYEGIDSWIELAPLLPVLVSLELILSADNAVALASIAKNLDNNDYQSKALNFGIVISLILRVILIFTAQSVINFWPIKLLAGLYLIILFLFKIKDKYIDSRNTQSQNINENKNNFINTIVLIAFTDLAFSIDSLAAAVAVSDKFILVATAALIGVLALRFTSGIFIRLLEIYSNLEFSGYFAVGIIGIKLLASILFDNFLVPEWVLLLVIFIVIIWGFSEKNEQSSS